MSNTSAPQQHQGRKVYTSAAQAKMLFLSIFNMEGWKPLILGF